MWLGGRGCSAAAGPGALFTASQGEVKYEGVTARGAEELRRQAETCQQRGVLVLYNGGGGLSDTSRNVSL